MTPFDLTDPPDGVALVDHQTDRYAFTHPQNGLLGRFQHDDGTQILSLLVPFEDDYLQFDIQHQAPAEETARQAAEAIYQDVSPLYPDDNVPPFALPIAGHEGWRCRKRFVDGFSARLIIDTAFLKVGQTLYRFRFSAAPGDYVAGVWIFDTLLRTFVLNPD